MSKEKYDYIMKLILIGDASINISSKYFRNEFDRISNVYL